MSVFKGQQGNAYYEIHGDDQKPPLLILNGIMMNTASWQPLLSKFTKNHRVILLDFYNQGKSDKIGNKLSADMNVSLVSELLDYLELDSVNLLGISYGGEISIMFAIENSNRLNKMILSNTTSHTDHLLRHMGYSWKYASKDYDAERFFMTCMPSIYGKTFYNNNIDWLMERLEIFKTALTKQWFDNFMALIDTAENYDERHRLKNITCNTLIISSDEDMVTPISEQIYLKENIKDSKHKIINGAGHALMYEAPNEYLQIINEFLK